jgi:peptidoglycan/xylan/chitin deacetylase (PgdA/CDA1 family)
MTVADDVAQWSGGRNPGWSFCSTMAALISVAQSIIRRVHVELLSRSLPPRVAIYLHEVEAQMQPPFGEMVECLRDLGYRFVTPDVFLDAADRVVFLSFDDNYRSWHTALPFFADLGVVATFYVNSCAFRDRASSAEIDAYFDRLHFHGERVPLSVAELREIAAAGHVVGAHGHSHRVLAALPAAEARTEIATSKRLLEDLLGQEVAHFAYPYGMRRHFNEDLRAFCRSVGFRTIANAIPGMQFARQRACHIQRSVWRLNVPMHVNLENLRADGRLFERLTGRSALG